MSFGPIMQLKVGELSVELAPLSREVMPAFVRPGMQQASITRYLERTAAPVEEDELEWFERIRLEKDSLIWGIYVLEGKERILIGNTGLMHIKRTHIHQAVSGSLIFRQEYWRKGIASAIHKARTWYAFQHLGLHRITSDVIQGNVGSLKALQKAGYRQVHVERNTAFVDGALRHLDNLECLNPNELFWRQWWHGDRPSKRALEARERSRECLLWAETHVTLL